MKSNKDVRATLCLRIYTTWRNKTYIVRGIAKKFSLRPVEAKSLLDCGIISFETAPVRPRNHSQGKYERIITFTPSATLFDFIPSKFK